MTSALILETTTAQELASIPSSLVNTDIVFILRDGITYTGTLSDLMDYLSAIGVEITDNLLGTTGTKALSENQGRILKGLVDAKANAAKNAKILLNFNGLNNSTLFFDESPNNYTTGIVAVSGAKLSTAVKKFGTASLYLPVNHDYIQIPANVAQFANNDFCIELWVYPTARATYGGIFQWNANYHGFALQFGSGTDYISLLIGNASQNGWAHNVVSSHTVASNVWTHLAVTREGQIMRVFINGVKTIEINAATTIFPNPTSLFNIGGFGNHFGVGYIDAFRITEGSAVYTANFTPPTAEF